MQAEGCLDTSDVQFITFISTETQISREVWKIYPNPTQKLIFVQGKEIKELTLLNVHGQTVKTAHSNSGFRSGLETEGLQNGVYWLEMRSSDRVEKVKVVVQR